MKPKVAIIVLNYNRKDETLDCLESLFRISYPNFQVILIDNGSSDGTVQAVRKKFPKIKILENNENLGFAEGNNVGIREALKNGANYILLLNNDTIVSPNFLEILIKNVYKFPDFQVFSPQIRKYPQKNKIWYAGGRFWWPFGSIQMFGRNQMITQAKLKKPFPVSFVTGCAMLVRADLLKKVGLMDKKFFLYWEETDWEARALKLGAKFLYIPDSVIWHRVAATSGGEKNPKMQYYFYRNNLLFARKNLPFYLWPTFFAYFWARIFLVEFCLGLVELILGRRNRWQGLKYIFLGISDFSKNKFGPRKL